MNELIEEMQKTWKEFKGLLEIQDVEIKKLGGTLPETKSALETLNKRLDELEVKSKRPLQGENSTDKPLEIKAFSNFLRKGVNYLSPEETKALSTDIDVEGGYLVPTILADRIIEKLHLFSPIRTLANIETITRGSVLEMPVEGAVNYAGGWVGERQARPVTDTGQFHLERIPTHEMYAAPAATQTMLDDTGYNIEAWIEGRVAKRLGVIEGEAFVIGNGVNKPEGLLTRTGVTSVISGHASALTADGLIDLFHALPEAYVRNATWLLRRATVGAIRKLKDPTGAYIWQPGFGENSPPTILGRPYTECVDMPLVSAGTSPIIFGDIKSAYTIVDRKGISVLRDPYSLKPYVIFYTTKRVGGQVVLPEAMVKQLISAS